jgi:hypothetical protein
VVRNSKTAKSKQKYEIWKTEIYFNLPDFRFLLWFSAFAFCLVDHRGHDGHEFIGFLFQGQCVGRGDATVFTQEFQPELGFVGFLQGSTQLGNEFVIGSRPGSFPDVCGNRGSGTQKLLAKHASFFPVFGNLDEQPNRRCGEALGAVSEFVWQAAGHSNQS